MTVTGKLERFYTIGDDEINYAIRACETSLSGYLGGNVNSNGYWINRLEYTWRERFGVTHAIACNSATSGLLAACHAVGVTNETVVVSPYTMSATAAAPAFLGADIEFADIDQNYCLDPHQVAKHFTGFDDPKAVIATNLFGHPAQLDTLKKLAHAKGAFLIEDNAQAPFAVENNAYAGTIGDIGVFSLNIHKHIQCGEGGIIVTDNDDFADDVRHFINHGEMAGQAIGLNLRMTETTAAIACAQLEKATSVIQSRVDLAELLIDGLRGNDLFTIQPPRPGCKHVYYVLPMEIHKQMDRSWVLHALSNERIPIVPAYVAPLYWMPAFSEFAPDGGCPITEQMHKKSLIYFEICAYDPVPRQVREIIDGFSEVAEKAAVLSSEGWS